MQLQNELFAQHFQCCGSQSLNKVKDAKSQFDLISCGYMQNKETIPKNDKVLEHCFDWPCN